MVDENRIIRILSIDGGGARGIIAALILQALEDRLRHFSQNDSIQLIDYFDLVAATSTGGIIALGLATLDEEGKPILTPKKLVALYEDHGPRLFHQTTYQKLLGFLKPGFDARNLEQILEDIAGDRRLSSCSANLLLPAYDIQRRTVKIFKMRRHADCQKQDPDYRVRDVARAITAAPTVFSPALIREQTGAIPEALIDGGIFANNPALCGYIEGRKLFGNEQMFFLLSVGCGQVNRRFSYERVRDWGIAEWLHPRFRVPLLDMIMDGQSDNVHHHLTELLEEGTSYFRFDPQLGVRYSSIFDGRKTQIAGIRAITENYIDEHSTYIEEVAHILLQTRSFSSSGKVVSS